MNTVLSGANPVGGSCDNYQDKDLFIEEKQSGQEASQSGEKAETMPLRNDGSEEKATKTGDADLAMARQALVQAQENAFGRGYLRQSKARLLGSSRSDTQFGSQLRAKGVSGNSTGYDSPTTSAFTGVGLAQDGSGARAGYKDPQRLKSLVDAISQIPRWRRNLDSAKVLLAWPKIAGPALSEHTQAKEFIDGKLTIEAKSTNWANQLRLFLPQIMRKCDEVFGAGVVKIVNIMGPQQHSFKRGPRSVPGRGPRDTYG